MRTISLSFGLVAFCLGSLAGAVEMEKGAAYLTDSHGASGVARAFLELSEVAPEYDTYWRGALDWLIAASETGEGYRYWYMSTTAPHGHPSHRISIPGMCGVAQVFFAGYRRCGDERYRDAGLDAARTLVERIARQRETEFGTAYLFSPSYRKHDRSQGLLAGHSHGLGNVIDALLDAYEAATDAGLKQELQQALTGLLANLRSRCKEAVRDGEMLVAWPSVSNPRVVETGYCYGQAGVVLPLLRMAEVCPEIRLSDGTTPLSLANSNLRYLMRAARPVKGGYVWPYMRHSERTWNIGYGSGTGGIGWALLRGAEVNRASDPAFADRCMSYARGATVYAVNLVLSDRCPSRLTTPGGDLGFGTCGGAGGGGILLLKYVEAAGDDDPQLSQRALQAVERIARLVINSATEVGGGLVCADRSHFKRVNLALDYGQTGIMLALCMAGKSLANDELLDAAKRVADYIAQRAVEDSGGLKFAQFHPLP